MPLILRLPAPIQELDEYAVIVLPLIEPAREQSYGPYGGDHTSDEEKQDRRSLSL